jgi:hypothetical protein
MPPSTDLTMPPPTDLTMPPSTDLTMRAGDLTMPPPLDLALPDGADLGGLPPMPQATHVGVSAVTCCIVSHPSGRVLYLANPDPTNKVGELHLAAAGGDAVLSAGVPVLGYAFSPDGGSVLFVAPGLNSEALMLARVATPTQSVTLIADGLSTSPLTQQGFFTPSGKYFLVGVLPPNVAMSQDLHVVDVAAGRDAVDYGNGTYDYMQVVTADDTMFFQMTVNGTSPTSPPVQTLFRISLPAAVARTASPTKIDIHTSTLALTPDSRTLVYNRTSGALFAYDVQSGVITSLAASAVTFFVGPLPGGPIAFVASDGSLHLASVTAELWAAPAGTADLFSPVDFSPDGAHLFFFKNVIAQGLQGDLFHVEPPPGPATVQAIATSVAFTPVQVTADGRMLHIDGVDMLGFAGSLMGTAFDGAGTFLLDTGVWTGNMGSGSFTGRPVFVDLSSAMKDADPTHTPIDGSPAVTGTPAFGISTTASQQHAAGAGHANAWQLSDDSRYVLLVVGAAWNRTAINYVGALQLYQPFDGMNPLPVVGGVSEVGPVTNRALFVNAPTATPPGVYLVRY